MTTFFRQDKAYKIEMMKIHIENEATRNANYNQDPETRNSNLKSDSDKKLSDLKRELEAIESEAEDQTVVEAQKQVEEPDEDSQLEGWLDYMFEEVTEDDKKEDK